MKNEITIDNAVVAKHYPRMLEHGNLFKLTKDKNDCYTLQAFFETTDGSIIKINHAEARYMGTLGHIYDAQIEFNFLKDAIREVVREEIKR